MQTNIFSTLHKYGSRARENFITEAFAYLLQLLLEREPDRTAAFLTKFIGLDNHNPDFEAPAVHVDTQVRLPNGLRPDIEIRLDSNVVAYVEVKDYAALHTGQLESYATVIDHLPSRRGYLILLTRSRSARRNTTLTRQEFHHNCWYEVYQWLEETNFEDEISKFMVLEFLGFLRKKRMYMKRVSWEYTEGVPSMLSLTDMIEAALGEVLPKTKLSRTAGWSWRGFRFGQNIWCGIRYRLPTIVSFENNGGNKPTFKKDLDLQAAHFLALSEGEQFERIVAFIQEASDALDAYEAEDRL